MRVQERETWLTHLAVLLELALVDAEEAALPDEVVRCEVVRRRRQLAERERLRRDGAPQRHLVVCIAMSNPFAVSEMQTFRRSRSKSRNRWLPHHRHWAASRRWEAPLAWPPGRKPRPARTRARAASCWTPGQGGSGRTGRPAHSSSFRGTESSSSFRFLGASPWLQPCTRRSATTMNYDDTNRAKNTRTGRAAVLRHSAPTMPRPLSTGVPRRFHGTPWHDRTCLLPLCMNRTHPPAPGELMSGT
jgi:hypothetical protein